MARAVSDRWGSGACERALLVGLSALSLPCSALGQIRSPDQVRPASCFTPAAASGPRSRGSVYGVFPTGQDLYVAVTAGTDTTEFLRVPLDGASRRSRGVQRVREVEGRSVRTLRAARIDGDDLVVWTDARQLTVRGTSWTAAPNPDPDLYRHHASPERAPAVGVDFAALWVPMAWVWRWTTEPLGGRRYLVWTAQLASNAVGRPPGPAIVALPSVGEGMSGDKAKAPTFHPLPQPTRELFDRLTRGGAADSVARSPDALEDDFGAFDVRDEVIWFGLTFYDGEGVSGVGGFGRFDTRTGRYEIRWGEPSATLSVTALIHDGQALWVGLAGRHEYSDSGEGVVRLDPASGATRHYDVPGVVAVLCPAGGAVWAGTDRGLYRLSGGGVEPVIPRTGG